MPVHRFFPVKIYFCLCKRVEINAVHVIESTGIYLKMSNRKTDVRAHIPIEMLNDEE